VGDGSREFFVSSCEREVGATPVLVALALDRAVSVSSHPRLRGKDLATFLKAIGFVILLMDHEYVSHYIRALFRTSSCNMQRPTVQPWRVSSGVFFSEFCLAFCMVLDGRNYGHVVEPLLSWRKKAGILEIAWLSCYGASSRRSPKKRRGTRKPKHELPKDLRDRVHF
jgi:hypothetical protein